MTRPRSVAIRSSKCAATETRSPTPIAQVSSYVELDKVNGTYHRGSDHFGHVWKHSFAIALWLGVWEAE